MRDVTPDGALFQIGGNQKDSSSAGSAIIMNYLTTLLDLCMDDKTAQSTQKTQDKMSHVFENSTRPKREQAKTVSSVNAGSQVDKEK